MLSMRIDIFLGCLACALLAGCSGLPIAGPTAREVVDRSVENDRLRYDLVDVDRGVVDVLRAEPQPSFRERFRQDWEPPPVLIGVGDTLSVTIWQVSAAAGAAPAAAGAAGAAGAQVGSFMLPPQVVGPDGGITVPYAGRIVVAGKLPRQVEQIIETRLAKTVAGAQAIVTVNSVYNVVSVGGEVEHGARIPLPLNGERLLDVIAAAGGAKAPVFDTLVQLTRHGVTVTIPMARLVSEPAENIYAWPGDILTLIVRPKSFIAFGATGQNTVVNFDRPEVTLDRAVAKAGGLIDERADPTGVFLFRYERPEVVGALRAANLAIGPDGSSPVIFRLDLRDPDGYLLAQLFPVKNNDILYVANAPLTITQKFLTLLATITGPVISGVTVTQAIP
jgi:polysaccharide biosynthesis/export protein